MQNKISKTTLLLLFLTLQISGIAARNYWECDSHPKVICQKNQTCCKTLVNDPAHYDLITSYQCFEGINLVCCGSRGVCAEDEYCNPILSKCDKIKLIKENAEEKQKEEAAADELKTQISEGNIIKENKLNFLFDQEAANLESFVNSILNSNPTISNNKNKIINNNTNKKENEDLTKLEKDFLAQIPLEMEDLISFNYNKILESISPLLSEITDLNCTWRNLTKFASGFLHGLQIFESAYRNTTCEADIKKVAED